MNENTALELKRFVVTALEPLGLPFQLSNIRYGEDVVCFKLDIFDKGVDTFPVRHFKESAHLFGLRKEDLGRTFIYQGRTYRIAGLKCRNTKYPILCVDEEGADYTFTPEMVQSSLVRGKPAQGERGHIENRQQH